VVQLSVDEKDVHLLKTGAPATVKAPFRPKDKLPAHISKLATVPSAPGKFDASVVLDAEDPSLMPGMACSVHFVPYSKDVAITVPAQAIYDEGDQSVVFVAGTDGRHEKRPVTPGRTDGQDTEIVEGLREGEEVLLERPGAKAPAKEGAAP
jgi:multidrug efflux pump subunit AcrA (membrane-fusion protein)